MGLLPIIFSTLSIFTAVVVITLLVSFIIYKIKSPKKKPYMEQQPAPVPVPVYIQKINYQEVRKEQPVYQQENVRKVHHQHSRNENRFQVLNSQQMSMPTGFTYYR